MKKNIFFALIAVAVLSACQNQKESNQADVKSDSVSVDPAPVTLTKLWETDTTLTTCESVIYDSANNVLYVSNIAGAPDGKDGNGSIAKVSLDGKIVDPSWVKGIDAPKGMGIANGLLYVTDIDRVHEINIAKGKISKTHKVEGAKFLNDIDTDESGKVYISDMGSGKIHVIENGKLSTWMDNVPGGPNGLFVNGNELMVATFESKTFNGIDLASKQITMKADSIENGDGVESLGNGEFLVSSWNGMVHHVGQDGKVTMVLDTRKDEVNAADIEYVPGKNLLLVPGFFKNKVIAYEVK